MLARVDHIDIRVSDLDAAVTVLSLMGLHILRETPPPRASVEMALDGENQVTIELHRTGENETDGVHHIAFKGESKDVERLKRSGIQFSTENKLIPLTGRTVSSFRDANGLTWQLTD